MGAMDTVVQSELGVNCTPLQFACPKSNLLAKSVLDEAGLVRILEIHLFGHMHTDCLDKSDCGYIMLCLRVIPKCLLLKNFGRWGSCSEWAINF